MSVRAHIASLVALLFSLAAAGPAVAAAAADQKKVVDQLVALNAAALESLKAGDHEGAKDRLLDAVVMGKKAGLGMHAVMARTYVHLGIVYIEGLKDQEKGVRYIGLALRVRPDIEPATALATAAVKSAFDQARAEVGGAAAAAKAPEPAAAAPVEEPPAEKVAPAKEAKKAAAADEKLDRRAAERAAEEKDKLLKDLAAAREAEKKEREAKEKLQKALAEADKQIAAAKERQQKDSSDKEKQLAEAKDRLQKEKAALEKKLAEAQEREKKEREEKEKIIKDKQQLEARDKERKGRDEKERLEREKLAEAPDMPSSVPKALFCPTRDEARPGADLTVHCTTQPSVKAKEIALYYRPSGVLHFNSIAMEPSKKGWHAATIPAGRVSGKLLQYYVEAIDARGDVVATNGKAVSPNIMMLKAGASTAPPAVEVASVLDEPAAPPPAAAKKARPAPKAAARKKRGNQR